MRAFKSGVVAGGAMVPADEKSITISCERTTRSGNPGIVCNGTAKGFSSGTVFIPHIRFPGETAYRQLSRSPGLLRDGKFQWYYNSGKKIYVYFTTLDGVVQSNRVIVPAV
jgi:hypothetical protein